jgi:hypothetical protein
MKEKVRPLIKKLSYDGQEYWDVTDVEKLRHIMSVLAGKSSLDAKAPFPYHQEGLLMSKDPTVSVLAAYGTTAPTLRTKGGQNWHIPAKHRKSKNPEFEGDNKELPGIAIYQDATVSAARHWKDLISESSLSFKLSPSHSYIGASKVIPAKRAGDLLNDIKELFGADPKGKKRAREDDDQETEKVQRKAKKAKREAVNTQLAVLLGLAAPVDDVAMEDDE